MFKKLVISTMLILALVTTTVFGATQGYKDVKPSQWFYGAVTKVSNLGIMSGYADGTFRPNDNVTRGQLAGVMAKYHEKVVLNSSQDEQKVIEAVAKSTPKTVKIVSDMGSGSGAFVQSNFIITNYHVVGVNTNVTIKLSNGVTIAGTVVHRDMYRDLALIHVEGKYNYFNYASSITVGQTAIAIGNPLGQEFSVAKGIVSKLNIEGIKASTMFQLDTSINYGNSGGAVINSKGELLGVVVGKFVGDDAEGLGFAITKNEVQKFVSEYVK